jgi:hypothetical protein
MTDLKIKKAQAATTKGSWKSGSAFGGERIAAKWNIVDQSGAIVGRIAKECGKWSAWNAKGGRVASFAPSRSEALRRFAVRGGESPDFV